MNGLYEDRDAATAAAERIKVFAQAQRLMILSCLLRGERNVGEIAEITGIAQPALSQQLGELRRAELVHTRKEAKQVWYMLASESVALCMRNIEAMFAGIESALPVVPESAPHAPPATAGVASFAQIIRR